MLFDLFGYRYFILNNGKERLEKFDTKSDEAIFLSYSSSSKAFRVFNKRTLIVEESIHVVFDKTNDLPSRKNEDIDDADPLIEGMKEITLKDSQFKMKKNMKTNKRMKVKNNKNNLKAQIIYLKNGGIITITPKN